MSEGRQKLTPLGLLQEEIPPEEVYLPDYSDTHLLSPTYQLPFQNYSRNLVIVHTTKDDVGWVFAHLGDSQNLSFVHYAVDDKFAAYKIPVNKGNEAMPYLTYIINRYDNLPDVSIFMHADRFTWHNNDLLELDAVLMIERLSTPKVLREGYVNLRCHLDPGCPEHLHPRRDESGETFNSDLLPEEKYVAKAWRELFPGKPVPYTLSQPCCSQFAVSAERIQSIPRERYIWMRKWVEDTDLQDSVTGRIWEYVWQYLWTGQHEYCPEEYICYCDAYGVCFEDEDHYKHYFKLKRELDERNEELAGIDWHKDKSLGEEKITQMRSNVKRLKNETRYLRESAWSRGMDPQVRAEKVGRKWEQGDGY